MISDIKESDRLYSEHISFSRESSQPRDRTWLSCIAGRLFTHWATREALRTYNRSHLLENFEEVLPDILIYKGWIGMNSKGYRDGGSIAGRGPMGERYKNKHRIFKELREGCCWWNSEMRIWYKVKRSYDIRVERSSLLFSANAMSIPHLQFFSCSVLVLGTFSWSSIS